MPKQLHQRTTSYINTYTRTWFIFTYGTAKHIQVCMYTVLLSTLVASLVFAFIHLSLRPTCIFTTYKLCNCPHPTFIYHILPTTLIAIIHLLYTTSRRSLKAAALNGSKIANNWAKLTIKPHLYALAFNFIIQILRLHLVNLSPVTFLHLA